MRGFSLQPDCYPPVTLNMSGDTWRFGAAVDDKVVAFRFTGDRLIDGGYEQIVVVGDAKG